MIKKYRMLASLALACAMSAAGVYGADEPKPADAPAAPAAPAPASPAPAAPATPDAPATPAPAAPATPGAAPAAAPADTQPAAPEIPQNQSLRDDVDDFWHYGKIARYDMAGAFGEKILTRTEKPTEILEAFQATAAEHHDNLDDWIFRWQRIDAPGFKGVAAKIQDLLNKGRSDLRTQPKYITDNIEALAVNERSYRIHIDRLKETGELAVPLMLDYLASRDPARAQFKDPVRRALRDMGREALNPLLAATETKDDDLKLSVINILGQIGYDVAAPYLLRITQDRTHPGLAEAASNALRQMRQPTRGNVADAFFRLAEKFYYGVSALQPDAKAPVAYIWFSGEQGLTYKEIPPAIFGDVMSERACEYALQLGPGTRDALSLWLAANNKLEVDLPEGASSGVFEKDRPAASYYNVYAGAQYLNAALTRVLTDQNAPVAMKLIKSLGDIVGPSSQGTGGSIDPLVQSMHYPDRLVRFEAAFALTSGLPTSPFPGHERVAPLLAEAVSQTGSANVLVIAPSQGDVQKYADALKQYGVASGTNANEAINNALKLPAVDVIVFPEELGTEQIDRVYQLAASNPRLERAAKVIITPTKLSPWAERSLNDPLTVVTQSTDAAGVVAAVEDARKRAGGLPLDEKVATAYAIRAAQTLQRLAEGRVAAFDLTVTQPTLLASLNDARPDVVKAVGNALAYMDGQQIQVGLLTAALSEKTADDVRIVLLQSLAKNVKFFGNHLAGENIEDLQKQVDTAANLDVRTAAAEVRGALNLPAEQAKELIVKQAKR